MLQEDIEFLEANKHHYIKAINDTQKGISNDTALRMEKIMSDYFRPGYRIKFGCCGPNLIEMIKILYTHYQQFLDSQPIEVYANFPKHNKK